MKDFIYWVDGNDRIIFVDANWLAFAQQNGMGRSNLKPVIGTSLWSHISDITTRHFYQLLMTDVRNTSRPATVAFRCDGPECRRFMELRITGAGRKDLEFRSRLLREERRERMALLDSDTPRSSEMLLMCLWCKKVKTSAWQEVEAAVNEFRLFEQDRMPMVSHVTCPACESLGLRTILI